nr:hypothetical protein [Clostridium botulinum]
MAINRYCEMYKSDYPYCNYKWTLNEFLTREKGIGYFLDDGDKWINYCEWNTDTKGKKHSKNNDVIL